MRKKALILSAAATLFVSGLSAQTMYDALRFSENYYEGTARTMAMGNAFTALGGDPGSITINPAGSAVAKYSQITISPGLSISTNTAQGTILSGDTSPYSFENRTKNSMTKFSIPNYAVTLNFDTHRTTGVKNVNIGFIVNRTNKWQDALEASGTNYNTTYMGALAAASSGYLVTDLEDTDNYYDGYQPWSSILGIQSGMINTFGGNNSEYVGASEKVYDNDDGTSTIELAGPLNQRFRRRINGSKYDYAFNFGLNISDLVYLGMNLGITSFSYNSSERFNESAMYTDDFEIIYNNPDGTYSTTYFSEMQHDYSYRATGVGVYGKFGILVTPGAGFRFGAAIQTPTATNIDEYWQESAATYYTDRQYNMSGETPEGEYSYSLKSPWRFNLGLAYTLGQFAVVSADYEFCDYSTMKLAERNTFGSGLFDAENDAIKEYMGAAHALRLGVEIKPVQQLALRAGYNLTTSPEKYLDMNNKLTKSTANVNKISAGLGYISNGSFYLDAACGYSIYSPEYVYPYNDYVDFPSPEILNKKGLWQVMMTFGFRF